MDRKFLEGYIKLEDYVKLYHLKKCRPALYLVKLLFDV